MTLQPLLRTLLIPFVLCNLAYPAYSQDSGDSTEKLDVSGTISVMSEGISTVPSLSLGEPAMIYYLSVGKRFRFEPELRFSLEGRPWSFLFWFRYDVVENEKFYLRLGAHPAYSFRTVPALIDEASQSEDIIEARRFLAGDLNATYALSEHMDIGLYYLFGHGYESSVPDQTHYLSLFSTTPDIPLFSDVYLNFRPQVYYLKIDDIYGVSVATSITLGVSDIPVTISSSINKVIYTEIDNDDPLWNVSLNYSFYF